MAAPLAPGEVLLVQGGLHALWSAPSSRARCTLADLSRVLIISENAEVLEGAGRVAHPERLLLFQATSLEDLGLRLVDLQPDVVVLDADGGACADVQGLAQALTPVPTDRRPQVLLLCRDADPRREAIIAAARPDARLSLPVKPLDLQVELRTLVRMRGMMAEACRDRDVLAWLLELSTFSGRFERIEDVLDALVGRVAGWTAMPHVVVTLDVAGRPVVAAATHPNGSLGSGRTLVDRRHGELRGRGDVLLVKSSEGLMAGEDPATLPYIGIPLKTRGGETLGALHAWGGARLPGDDDQRILQLAAERISTEIQLRDANRRLEETVRTRTVDLTALLDRLRAVNEQLVQSSRETIVRLARAAEYRDPDTGEHVDRMSDYARIIARRMGMGPEEQALVRLATPMHDVGKIGIPDAVLHKDGPLTGAEYEIMKQHPAIGARILGGSQSKLLQMAEQIAASHHERWDGKGYPKGLAGGEIPLVGRIVALADVFDALTSPRVYKDAWSVHEAVAHIRRGSGAHFDPKVVAAFDQCLDELIAARARYAGRAANGEAGAGADAEDQGLVHPPGHPRETPPRAAGEAA